MEHYKSMRTKRLKIVGTNLWLWEQKSMVQGTHLRLWEKIYGCGNKNLFVYENKSMVVGTKTYCCMSKTIL
jgi:hypothetical protein